MGKNLHTINSARSNSKTEVNLLFVYFPCLHCLTLSGNALSATKSTVPKHPCRRLPIEMEFYWIFVRQARIWWVDFWNIGELFGHSKSDEKVDVHHTSTKDFYHVIAMNTMKNYLGNPSRDTHGHFVIGAILVSFWNVSIKFRWHGEKYAWVS